MKQEFEKQESLKEYKINEIREQQRKEHVRKIRAYEKILSTGGSSWGNDYVYNYADDYFL